MANPGLNIEPVPASAEPAYGEPFTWQSSVHAFTSQ
jgi:hypothetical protein